MRFTLHLLNLLKSLSQRNVLDSQFIKFRSSVSSIIFLLSTLPTTAQGQYDSLMEVMQPNDTIHSEIQLSDTIDLTYAGLWEIDNYKIYVELKSIEAYLKVNYESLVRNNETMVFTDSVYQRRCILYAERHKIALDQIQHAVNGFDLRQFKLHFWADNADPKVQSHDIEMLVRQKVESGQAAVFYHDQRLYKLKTIVLQDYIMSSIVIYADNNQDALFRYIFNINW